MTVWRMSMRCGNEGYEMWPQCQRKGVAAICYEPFAGMDLRKFEQGEPAQLWAQLAAAQVGFLRRVAYDMTKGDTIYVKQGPGIVGRGTVLGSYQFDRKGQIICPDYPQLPFAHQVPVKWEPEFEPIDILLGSEPSTVLRLDGKRLKRLEAAVAAANRRKRRR